jgi:hypothetical protein
MRGHGYTTVESFERTWILNGSACHTVEGLQVESPGTELFRISKGSCVIFVVPLPKE